MNAKENHKHKPSQRELPDFSAKTYVGGRQAFEQVVLGKLGTYMQKNEARSIVILHKKDYNQSLKGLKPYLRPGTLKWLLKKKQRKHFKMQVQAKAHLNRTSGFFTAKNSVQLGEETERSARKGSNPRQLKWSFPKNILSKKKKTVPIQGQMVYSKASSITDVKDSGDILLTWGWRRIALSTLYYLNLSNTPA